MATTTLLWLPTSISYLPCGKADTTLASTAVVVYIYRWDRHDRKGQRCTVQARGTMNSCLVCFKSDGYRMVTSRNALRRA